MDFELTEEQRMLAESAASFARKTSPVERLRRLRTMPETEGVEQRHPALADPRNWEKSVWKQMAELGWLGLFYPEEIGGLGLSFFDASLVIEKLGTTLVPEPYVASVVLAGWAVLKAGDRAQQARLLGPMIEGETSLALAWQERAARYDAGRVETRATKTADGWSLSGEKVYVLNGHAAEHLIVSARRPDGSIGLFAVPVGATGLTVTSITTMDANRAAFVELEGVAVPDADHLAGDGLAAVEWALDLGAAAACAEGLGIVRAMTHATVEYLKVRKQFGVAIGTFQALQHRAVDMFVQTQLLESTSTFACVHADSSDADARRRHVSIGKARLGAGGKFVSQSAVQLHGGIGVTDEHDIGLFFKRMQVLVTQFGDEDFHVRRFASRDAFDTTVGD